MSGNSSYDPERETELRLEDLEIDAKMHELPDEKMIVLWVEQKIPEGRNVPYSFKIGLVGLFHVVEGVASERAAKLLLTNGSSILYGVAREIVRDLTARGPHPSILLPTVSFLDSDKPEQKPSKPRSAKKGQRS